ncbi:Bax inhibitor-1/YccA family protein [Mycolicibacterium sp. 141076]|uniref:Bax inhibitor-1/YccA family protein n=1 Tax=Mycolicibacterium sp. 141076 TaxID=3090599 RepID=UPI00299EE4C0|nr:Bax inhibitor-1/YccA family protein [Mycolicibacterium sp. 141076]MDX1881042.1 Bax inhibitor-1/YccA family protein [Mycolicibacterium sp. 141076]
MRESSNPIFRSLPKSQGGYAQFGSGAAAYGAQQTMAQPYTQYPQQQAGFSRALTIDDVVTKTAMTLSIVSVVGVLSYFFAAANPALMFPMFMIGSIGGLVLVLIATFGRKQDNPAIVLSYAAFEGLFVGTASYLFANLVSTGGPAMIFQAVVATFGVFAGMLVVYKTGAIRVTPKFTRMMVAAMFGVVALSIVNILFAIFTGNAPLTNGGGLAIIFSLVCIALAAFSFLLDFDAADQMIRAGAPEKAAWGVALGLTVTLVWLYVEILRLLSYFNND